MKKQMSLALLAALVAVGASAVQAPARAEASRVAEGVEASWSGGPFLVNTSVVQMCALGPTDPTCDHHAIEVEPGQRASLEIVVRARDGVDLGIVVFDEAGDRVAKADTWGDFEVLTMPASSGRFTVSVSSSVLYVNPNGVGAFDATAKLTDGEPRMDVSCAGSVPDAPLEAAEPLELSVLTLLDGIPLARGQAIVERARVSWDDAGIELTLGFDDSFDATSDGVGIDHQGRLRDRANSDSMFKQARAHVGGRVPSGYDAVVVLTDKDLSDWGSEYMGVAYCLGALGSPTSAFALGEAWADEWQAPFGLQRDLTAIIWSHELGHLANAPHHYGECTLGAGRADAGDGSHVGEATCSLMQYIGPPGAGKLTTANLYFSHLSRLVVRAHVDRHRD